MTDNFTPVDVKLRELASGAWKGKDLSYRVGSAGQKQKMHIPVLQVRVTPTVSILWQLDIGFDHEDPDSTKQQQIVKGTNWCAQLFKAILTVIVWHIATSDEEV